MTRAFLQPYRGIASIKTKQQNEILSTLYERNE